MDVKGQAAIVTGAGSGLGAETARFLAKAGAKVAVLDLDGAAAVADAADPDTQHRKTAAMPYRVPRAWIGFKDFLRENLTRKP